MYCYATRTTLSFSYFFVLQTSFSSTFSDLLSLINQLTLLHFSSSFWYKSHLLYINTCFCFCFFFFACLSVISESEEKSKKKQWKNHTFTIHESMVVKISIWILRFYDSTCPKQSGSFKDLCNRSRSVGLYNSDNLKRSWFLVIFFNLTKSSVWPKWRITSQ